MTRKFVYVERNDERTCRMFVNEGWTVTVFPEDADLICLVGGPDVTPSVYGEQPEKETISAKEWDIESFRLYAIARVNDIPIVGICRGHQFLAAVQGCPLIQHLPSPRYHQKGVVFFDNEDYECMFDHHQAVPDQVLYLESVYSFCSSDDHGVDWVIYTNKSMGVQFHPEWQNSDGGGYKLFFKLLSATLNTEK